MATLARWQSHIAFKLAGDLLKIATNVTIEVIDEVTGLPPLLYADRAGAVPLGNPFSVSTADGYVFFHVTGGVYKITATQGGLSKIWRYVGIGTLNEGDKDATFITPAQVRERLTGPRTYFVRPDGNEANTGLVNNAAGAFLTVQRAINVIVGTLDFAGNAVTIQMADGTYTGGGILQQGWTGGGSLTVQGNTSVGTVTVSIANPAVVHWVNHGLVANKAVQFFTTGVLPNGGTSTVLMGIDYYVKTVIDTDNFTISATPGGAALSTAGGSQSGVHTARAANNVFVNYKGSQAAFLNSGAVSPGVFTIRNMRIDVIGDAVVTGAVNNGGGAIRLTVDSSADLLTGTVVSVSSVGGTTNANGTWSINVIDATHIDLVGSVFNAAYTSGGRVSLITQSAILNDGVGQMNVAAITSKYGRNQFMLQVTSTGGRMDMLATGAAGLENVCLATTCFGYAYAASQGMLFLRGMRHIFPLTSTTFLSGCAYVTGQSQIGAIGATWRNGSNTNLSVASGTNCHGPKFNSNGLSLIETGGATVDFFPGDVAGSFDPQGYR